MGRVVVLKDLVPDDRRGDPRPLIELPREAPQVRVIRYPPAVAAEVGVVHAIEAQETEASAIRIGKEKTVRSSEVSVGSGP